MTNRRTVIRRAQAVAALAAVPVTHRTPGSVLIHAGIRVEQICRCAYALYLDPVARFYGLATRAEVLRLREEVAHLEYRLDTLSASRSQGTSPAAENPAP